MAKYHLTNKAVEDLDSIWIYTIENWSIEQADKYYRVLVSEFQTIADRVSIDREYREIKSGLFGHLCEKHIVFYRFVDDEVEIIRILHQRMDCQRIL